MKASTKLGALAILFSIPVLTMSIGMLLNIEPSKTQATGLLIFFGIDIILLIGYAVQKDIN